MLKEALYVLRDAPLNTPSWEIMAPSAQDYHKPLFGAERRQGVEVQRSAPEYRSPYSLGWPGARVPEVTLLNARNEALNSATSTNYLTSTLLLFSESNSDEG
jgi:hypothetical protein